jgi:hypothetical protein
MLTVVAAARAFVSADDHRRAHCRSRRCSHPLYVPSPLSADAQLTMMSHQCAVVAGAVLLALALGAHAAVVVKPVTTPPPLAVKTTGDVNRCAHNEEACCVGHVWDTHLRAESTVEGKPMVCLAGLE